MSRQPLDPAKTTVTSPAAHAPSIESVDRWVHHPRGRIFTRTWPSDTGRAPIVLMHDSLGCVDLWRDFPGQLSVALGRPVIAYDRLGFGRSDARLERPSLKFVAEEASEYFPVLYEHLGLRNVVLLGHSVGGGMAIECAARLGSQCEALVTIAAQVFAEHRTLEGIRAARVSFSDARQIDRLARYHGDKTPWVLQAWIENWLDPAFSSWSVVDVLPRVGSPILALHGELDEYGTIAHAQLISQLSGGSSQQAILPGIGHVPHREQPEQVLGLVERFLRLRA